MTDIKPRRYIPKTQAQYKGLPEFDDWPYDKNSFEYKRFTAQIKPRPQRKKIYRAIWKIREFVWPLTPAMIAAREKAKEEQAQRLQRAKEEFDKLWVRVRYGTSIVDLLRAKGLFSDE